MVAILSFSGNLCNIGSGQLCSSCDCLLSPLLICAAYHVEDLRQGDADLDHERRGHVQEGSHVAVVILHEKIQQPRLGLLRVDRGGHGRVVHVSQGGLGGGRKEIFVRLVLVLTRGLVDRSRRG